MRELVIENADENAMIPKSSRISLGPKWASKGSKRSAFEFLSIKSLELMNA
jgi:hypothetical protein